MHGALDRLDEDVLLLADGELDHAFRVQIIETCRRPHITDRRIVHAKSSALNEAPRLAGRAGESGKMGERRDGNAGSELRALYAKAGKSCRRCAFLEGAPSGFGGLLGCFTSMAKRRRFGGE